jgi:FlaA1/EpsC-like NDP-sugar epimerase
LTILDSARLESLLGHSPIYSYLDSIRPDFSGKSILVTGAAGSIGSCLCKRLATLAPAHLACLDHNAGHLHHLSNELATSESGHSNVDFHHADIRDEACLQKILERVRPSLIFHVAAHKHVVPMESNVRAAVENNVFGTLALLHAVEAASASLFVFVSSDKAVYPTSIVGVTKRIGERMLGAWPSSQMRCISARFGNVLGSSGSVIPIWREQLDQGSALTVTDPEAERFFLLPEDAVTLLLQATTIGQHGDIFVFDMDLPVRILDLAHAFLKQNGRSSHNVGIRITGLGQGEKRNEQLFYRDELVRPTKFEKIKRTATPHQKWSSLARKLDQLRDSLDRSDTDIRSALKAIEPEYAFTLARSISTTTSGTR